MGNPLTVSSDVECSHKGSVAVISKAKLTIGGNAVLLSDGIVGQAIAHCTQVSASTTPCTNVVSITPASQALKLTVGGSGVILDTVQGVTNGAPPGKLMAVAGQSKLTAV
jgi:hypothetical protein